MELVAKQTKKQWNYWQNQANFLGTIWAHTKNPCGLWVKIEKSSNEWNEQCSISFHDTYIHYFCVIQRKAQTKYETNQASSASLFEPIRKVAFKSYITLRFFSRSKTKKIPKWITNTEYGCDLAINSSPMSGKQNVLFCYWWLPFHPNAKQEKQPKKIPLSPEKNKPWSWKSEHLFISPQSCVDLISFV